MTNLNKNIKLIIDNMIADSSIEYSYQQFLDDSAKEKKQDKEFAFFNSYFKRKLKFEIEYLNFINLKNSQLTKTLHKYFEKSEKAQSDYDITSYSYRVLDDFWRIFVVISNNYSAIKGLHLNGFDYQAKAVLRNTIELTDLCICCLGDEKFYSFFREQNQTDDPWKTFKTIKYGTIKKTTLKVINHIKQTNKANVPEELWQGYMSIRDENYDFASQHAHSNFLNIMLGSYVPIMEDKNINENMMLMNLGGRVNSLTEKNIKDVIVFDSISYMILLILLIDKHKLFFAKFKEDANFIVTLSKLNWDLLSRTITTRTTANSRLA